MPSFCNTTPLLIRHNCLLQKGTDPHSGTHHDRDRNAAINIRVEGIRWLLGEGSAVSAVKGEVRPHAGRKSKWRHWLISTET